jgi:hypothetical protein
MQVRRTAGRLESERGEEQDVFVEDCPEIEEALPSSAVSLVVGLDGAYVRARGQRSRTERWFEVIVGKSLATGDKSSKCLAS